MFTGIVEEIGTVKSLRADKLTVSASEVLKGTKVGDSIAVNGTCLTVTALSGSTFSVDVMPETLRRTNIGSLRPGDGVNLERALAAGGRIGGHFVQGHVDGTGRVNALVPENEALLMTVTAPSEITAYLVGKGFIAVDGVSLTVVRCNATSFEVSLVAFTRENTNMGRRKPGDTVNLEVDIMAKYVQKLCSEGKTGVSLEFLGKHGFLDR
ncbi:MAG: riboflavin synthase [Chloroflexi bacterium]|nr:riboflavin synthase [Chloroflexota bacterium]